MKKSIYWIIYAIVITGLVVSGYFGYQYYKYHTFSADNLDKIANLADRISTPNPLSGPEREKSTDVLEPDKIIEFTNEYREEDEIAPLDKNEKLTEAANLKINDMFLGQYFEHVSPIDQKNVTFFVGEVGYNYILVGENLAMGDFDSEEELVQGWMNSSGHRENIMNSGYRQIGVSARKGNFEGRDTWLAVQIFGSASSDCNSPSASLKIEIEQKQKEYQKIDGLNSQVTTLQNEGKSLIEQGNSEIEEGNKIFEETHNKSQAQPYWDEGENLQSEGNAKYDEANKIIEEINSLAGLYDEISFLIGKYNKQVDEYNKCLGA